MSRILYFDIETAPLLAHVWQAKTEYIGSHAFVHDTFMLSWAAKYNDRKTIRSGVLSSHEARSQDDIRIVSDLADVLRDADIVVGHNIARFDVPKLNSRLLLNDLEPLGPLRMVDTLQLARRSFKLVSNKLDYLAQMLGVGSKISTSFDLWLRCYHGDDKALREMARYNRGDVKIQEAVYEALLPHVKGLPRTADPESGDDRRCPHCATDSLVKRGFYHTNASTFQRWYCQQCRRYTRSRQAEKNAKFSTVPVS